MRRTKILRHPRIFGITIIALSVLLVQVSALPSAVADEPPEDTDPASRFFVDDALTFSGLRSSATFTITPSPGETITALVGSLNATADASEVLIDSFVDSRLIDSQRFDASPPRTISLGLGEIVASAEVTVRVSHVDDECRNDDTRIVELVDLAFVVEGEAQRPVGPQDFFPPHLSRVAVAMADSDDLTSQSAALDTMARIAARYRRDDFVVELVTLADLEFLGIDERAVIIDLDLKLLTEPQLSDYGPKVLRIHPLPGVAHLASMLELSAPIGADRDVYVQLGELTGDISAQGNTRAELMIAVPQTLFSRIPQRYDVHLAGWTSMAHTAEMGAQVLTVTAGGQVVFAQTVTDSGPFDVAFSIVEPPRDLELELSLRGPDIGHACEVETAALELALDPLSSIAPIGMRGEHGFATLPQGFEGIWSISAEGEAWSRAARLMTLVQRPSPVPLTVTDDGPVIAVELTTEAPAVLRLLPDGLHLEGTLPSIDELLRVLAEESWYALDGDIAQVGGTGLVSQFVEAEPVVLAGQAPIHIGAHATIAAVAPDTADDLVATTVESSTAAEFTTPPDELAYADDSTPIASTTAPKAKKDVPTSALAGAAVLTIAGGILVNRRDTLLGRRPGGA